MPLYLVTFDLEKPPNPPGNLYTDIYRDIRRFFGDGDYCKDFGQFCCVRSDLPVQAVKDGVRDIINRKSNHFRSSQVVVFSVGEQISITRGYKEEELRHFVKFFKAPRR